MVVHIIAHLKIVINDSCKDGASKSSNDDGVCKVNDMLQNMNTDDEVVGSNGYR